MIKDLPRRTQPTLGPRGTAVRQSAGISPGRVRLGCGLGRDFRTVEAGGPEVGSRQAGPGQVRWVLGRIGNNGASRWRTTVRWIAFAVAGRPLNGNALVAELADAHGSGPCGGNPLEVRILSRALKGPTKVKRPQPPAAAGVFFGFSPYARSGWRYPAGSVLRILGRRGLGSSGVSLSWKPINRDDPTAVG